MGGYSEFRSTGEKAFFIVIIIMILGMISVGIWAVVSKNHFAGSNRSNFYSYLPYGKFTEKYSNIL